jgi:hypothetical protein
VIDEHEALSRHAMPGVTQIGQLDRTLAELRDRGPVGSFRR